MTASPSDNPPHGLHTAEEIAAFLKVDPKTVFNWAKSGIIPEAFRVGKTVRYSLEAIKESLKIKFPDLSRSKRSTDDIVRLAFSMIDPDLFPPPSWMLLDETLEPRDADHARHIADLHREMIGSLDSPQEKIAYLGGALDAQLLMESGNFE